jgi:hypothetical protein
MPNFPASKAAGFAIRSPAGQDADPPRDVRLAEDLRDDPSAFPLPPVVATRSTVLDRRRPRFF